MKNSEKDEWKDQMSAFRFAVATFSPTLALATAAAGFLEHVIMRCGICI